MSYKPRPIVYDNQLEHKGSAPYDPDDKPAYNAQYFYSAAASKTYYKSQWKCKQKRQSEYLKGFKKAFKQRCGNFNKHFAGYFTSVRLYFSARLSRVPSFISSSMMLLTASAVSVPFLKAMPYSSLWSSTTDTREA